MLPEKVNHIIQNYQSITLAEMDEVRLLDRTDTKFTFKLEQLGPILEAMQDQYRILEEQNTRKTHYLSLYYDSPDLILYRHHHNGKLNRFKVRYRKYLESGVAFFEIKKKTNKGRTKKIRVRCHDIQEMLDSAALQFFENKLPHYPADNLCPSLWISYTRITLVSKQVPERVTIDAELSFKANGHTLQFPKLAIAEVKQGGKEKSSFVDCMNELHIKPGSISKYCLGIASLYPDVKQNNFKQKIIQLNQLLHDSVANDR